MAISGGDGSIILTTKVDTAGVTTGITKVKAAVTTAKTSLMSIGTTISKGFTNAFSTLSEKLKSAVTKVKKTLTGIGTTISQGLTKAFSTLGTKLNSLMPKIKQLGVMMRKAFLAIGAAAVTATVAITKMAVSAYADYEQLVGGVETLFKDSAGKVLEYANQAFQTAGVSANEYMQQVTSFSASLLSSLSGDTDKAADIANMALIDISDNVNKMGSSMESVALAYQGFAKQQYMLLDNLKLGYGGTKTEMERLLKDAQALTGVKYDINNLADVYSAIHAIQEQLGITGTTMKEAETTITGSFGMVKASWQNLLTAMSGGGDLDRAINNFVYSLEKFTANIAPVIERTLLGLGQAIQRTLPMLVQTVVSALVQQIPNLVMAVYNMIVGLFKGIVLGIKALFAGGTKKATEVIKGNISGISSGASSAADNMNDVADATKNAGKEAKKAGKEAKKSLAAFDELNILSSGESGASGESGGSGVGKIPEASMPTISAGGVGGGLLQDIAGKQQEIDAQLQAIMGVAGGALLAIGLLLLFSGNVIWGISFIIAGAVTFGVALQTLSQQDVVNPINEKLMTILAIAGTALAALGLILLFSGVWKWGIAFLVAGAAALGVAIVATKSGNVDKEAEERLTNVMTAAGAAMLALGVILLCFGVVSGLSIGLVVAGAASLAGAIALNPQLVLENVSKFLTDNAGLIVGISLALLVLGIVLCVCGIVTPLSIGMIVVGATGLVTEVVLNWNYITEQVTKFFNENSGLIVGVSLALLVIGIILCFTGVGIPLAIGLIVVGAAGLASEVALNWNYISTKVTSFFKENAGLIVGVSIALIVLGIILLFTGVGIPLAIGLIVAGGGALAAEVALNWNFIVDKVKEVWEKVKEFWNTYIAPIFTAKWWADLGKKAINGLLGVIEKGLNWIIDKINSFIDGMSKIVGVVGDLFGADWSIPKIPRVSIPRLAKGAVIPPNREFLAVLGDQKQGTNIEAPLQTIVDAFNIALAQNGGTVSGNTEVILEIDGREFGRAVVEQGNRENRRIGTRLVIA